MLRTCVLFLPALLALSYTTAHAQQHWTCGHQGNLDPELVARARAAGELRDGVRYVKTRVVVAALEGDDGELGLAAPLHYVQRDLDHANTIFASSGTGIQFQVCDPFEVVLDPALYNMQMDLQAVDQYRRPGFVNVIYTNSLPQGVQGLGGFDHALVVHSVDRQDILVHELGHVLGLPHTFGPDELVDGSNCATAGDGICDTPADGGFYQPGVDVDMSTCTYIGTATDANGDLYAPMLNNIMSYSPCDVDAFTAGQSQVMRYVLDSVMTYLIQTPNGVVIEPFPLSFCAHDEPTTVVATPLPGTFTGPFVQGDELVHTGNAGSTGHVTYAPDDVPDPGLFELVDAFHLPFAMGTPFTLPQTTDSVRQSFRAGRDGDYSRVEVRLASEVAITYRLRLYEGTDMDLVLLHDTVADWPGPGERLVSFAITGGVTCSSGTDYSFVLTADQPFTAFPLVSGSIANASNSLHPYNLWFNTRVWAGIPCQQATRHYTIKTVPERPILNLPEALCGTDEQDLLFLVNEAGLTASLLLVNGEPALSLVPADLGTGTFSTQHIYTIDSCTDTLSQFFSVEALPDFTFPELPALLCLDGEAITLAAEPALGSFTINGIPATELVPQVLGVGTHEVLHTYINALDTVTYPDQICCNQGFPFNAFLGMDSIAWQAFIPATTGTLESVEIPLELFAIPRTLIVELRSGEGLGGTLLHSDTILAASHDGVLLTGTGIALEAGNVYTWSIQRVADLEPTLPPMIGFSPGDQYPAAASHVPDQTGDAALRFRVSLNIAYACSSTEAFDVAVEICTGVDDLHANGFSAWPNPFTDQVFLRGGDVPIDLLLFSADGRLVHGQRLQAGATAELGFAHLAPGAYWFRASTLDGGALPGMPMLKVAY